MEPAVEKAAAGGAGLAAGCDDPTGESAGGRAVQECGCGTRRVYLSSAGSQLEERGRVSDETCVTPAQPGGTDGGAGADGAGAARAADVHQLRMVLRRDFRH